MWLNDAIRLGLVKLLSLRLDGAPPDDMIELTARTWLDSLVAGLDWDQTRDEPRIAAGFVTLARTRDSWPLPKHLLAALSEPTAPRLAGSTRPDPDDPYERQHRERMREYDEAAREGFP